MKTETVETIVRSALKANKAGGELELDAITKKLPQFPRPEVIRQIRGLQLDNAKFFIGRRGGKSRLVWGDKLVEKTVSNVPATPRAPRQPRNTPAPTTGGYAIRLSIGGHVKELPIEVDLVQV